MEPSQETISSRRDKLNAQIVGKDQQNVSLINKECLLDALQALYDECSLESLQKYDKQIGQFVDRYKSTISHVRRLRVNVTDFDIKAVIGRGQFGEVHVVKEKQTGDIYAMKTIKKGDSEKTSFDTERDIMAFSNSSWITGLQYAFQDSTYLFYVMEYHPGGDLLGLLYRQGGTLPESAATFYLAEIVLALQDLHSMGYVHRDIKPDNILLDRCGHLKLADFGSAARLGAGANLVPVGTPDYIAPEVLQCAEKTPKKVSPECDFWSLGILAFELAVGKTPFSSHSATATYSKIMNHGQHLKFPSDVLLTQAYVSFIRCLVTDEKSRLNLRQIRAHALFKNLHFDTLRDQVPPYVPKIKSSEDTSNFTDITVKKSGPSVENFKKKTQFSGRNLPFIGFTYTHGFSSPERGYSRGSKAKDDLIKSMKIELEELRRSLMKRDDFEEEKLTLEKKVLEKVHKLESIETVRDKLERDLANSIAENTALKRTLEIERKDRSELERKALDLIKSAKIKWEISERTKVDALNLEIDQQKEKIEQLTTTNKMLNEQLQKAFKLENKHKRSLEAVEQINRRSLVGLESKLEQVAIESRQKLVNIQATLDETITEKRMLENEIRQLKDNEEELINRLEKINEEYEVLNGAATEAEKLVRELNEKVLLFEKSMKNTAELEEKIKELTGEKEAQEATIKQLESQTLLLESTKEKLEESKEELAKLKEADKLKEKTINELESKLNEEENKCGSLQKQLQDSDLINESQQLKELRMKMWKMEKELGNVKIDKRILERELKEANTEIKDLKNEINNLTVAFEEKRKMHEEAIIELNNINENLSLELVKVKAVSKSIEEKLEDEKTRNSDEKSVINQLNNVINDKDVAIKELTINCNTLKNEIHNLELRVASFESEKERLVSELAQCKKANERLVDELRQKRQEIDNNHTNLEALREACILIENQVIEYEKINVSIQSEKAKLAQNTENLIKDLCKAKEEIQEAKKQTNEEKSLRLLAETKIKRCSEELECLKSECESYKSQCDKYRECSSDLSEQLAASEEKLYDLEVTVKSYERKIEDFVSENNVLKEEISQNLTQLAGMKEANFKLKQQVQDLKNTKSLLTDKCEQLEGVLNAKTMHFDEREIKYESTIKQQTKLIDYLQVKVDEHSNKKKTLTEKLFGHSKKENQEPLLLPVNYKDLDNDLQKQKKLNKDLQEEIYRLKAELSCKTPKITRHKSEIASPRTKLAMEQLTSKSELTKTMHHNIPHRFVTKLCKKLSKCDCCANQIMLGRDVCTCTECKMNVHLQCANSVKSTCGLPQEYAEHFKNSLSLENNSEKIDGWIKILNKNNTWDKRFALLSNRQLNIYDSDSKKTFVECIDLAIANCKKKIVLEPVPSEIGVNVAQSDLPFIIKLEVLNECWPVVSFVFMALSIPDRDKWYKALQHICEDSFDKYNLDSVFTVPNDVYANCVVDLTKSIKVLGTDQGLYAYYNNALLRIEGLSEVHQISIVPESQIVLMITDATSTLVSCDLNHLLNLAQCAPCTKPLIKYQKIQIKNLDGFHFLEVSPFGKHQLFCAATSKQLVIVRCLDGEFVPLRIMDTAEPIGCALFTEHSLIVGADKFFEIDLATFKAEEFLDASDVKLKPALKCHKLQSFPLGVLQVADNPKEYMLCFNEFCVFVDEYGRCSREKDFKTSYLPIGFHYIKPFLYVLQFSGVEIRKLDAENVVLVELKKMRFLGRNQVGIYVFHEGRVKSLEGRKLLDCDDSSVVSTETGEESDRFSFTSSMVQSLDGNLSDVESCEENTKRVKFSQTNL